ncbi:MAG TPA: DUF5916 domain-containing protein [Gemmatimonadaceae bacterium]|nr:DUF5916 domain-containing protein [Gemmatimonadaceae bacterium]
MKCAFEYLRLAPAAAWLTLTADWGITLSIDRSFHSRHAILCVSLFVALPAYLRAQQHAQPHALPTQLIIASPRTGPIALDGRLSEVAWQRAEAGTQFTQTVPDEGKPASERTEIRVLFDDAFVYFGARMYDSLGARGVTARQVRRDDVKDGETDYLMIILDTFHDHLGRMQFFVTPLGGKRDARGFGGETPDESWDPVWEVAAQIDSVGWTAEIRIPLSQLRMPADSIQVWGVNFIRSIARRNERAFFAFWRRNEPGGASRFAHLEGLRFRARRTAVEAIPFATVQAQSSVSAAPSTSLATPSSARMRLGGDYRFLVTSSFNLTGTILPDFGQVELDPAVVNLTAFETFLPEKRPFFVQDGTLFGTGDFLCLFCEAASLPTLFFSRRIGRAPQALGAAISQFDLRDRPEATPILLANKLTGRTVRGLSIGVIGAVTRASRAIVRDSLGDRSLLLEPSAQYLVGRVRQDLANGDVVFGATLTSTHRASPAPVFKSLFAGTATVGGVDWSVAWREKTYSWFGMIVGSHVGGNSAAITRLQTSSARYLQRPDRRASDDGLFGARFDTLATSLNGYGVTTRLGKDGGDWVGEIIASAMSPGFEDNDLGFQTRADVVSVVTNAGWSRTRPTQAYRELRIVGGIEGRNSFDGTAILRSAHSKVTVVLPNYVSVILIRIEHAAAYDDGLLRGGPLALVPSSAATGIEVSTDRRHQVVLQSSAKQTTLGFGGLARSIASTVTARPRPSVLMSAGVSIADVDRAQQFVTSGADSTAQQWYRTRYIFGDLYQRTGALTARFSIIPTKRLTIESFTQILISAARYDEYFEMAAPRSGARRYFLRGAEVSVDSSISRRRVTIDSDGPTRADAQLISFNDPTFTTRAVRGNVVARWEFRPGSMFTIVWQQSRNESDPLGRFRAYDDAVSAFTAPGTNVFAVKLSYWWPL